MQTLPAMLQDSFMTTRHLTLFLLLCLGCSKPTAEQSAELNDQIVFPYSKDSFDWELIETLTNASEKKRLTDNSMVEQHVSRHRLFAWVHSFDFNGDGLNDFVYSGPGPTDDWTTIIGITQSSGLKYFDLNGRVVDINFENKKVNRIFRVSVVATSPPIEGQTIVNVAYEEDLPVFKTAFASERASWTPLPNDKQLISFKFESIDDTLILRDSPIELDTPYNNFLEINGNQFGKILKGTNGQVVGQLTDSLHNSWLCALIYPNDKIIDYPFYVNGKFDSTDQTNRVVWIRDKGIKRVE